MLKAYRKRTSVTKKSTPPDVERFLPVTPVAFEILLAVAEQDLHGYAILRDIEASTDGQMRLNPGTLYRAIGRLVDSALLEELEERDAPDLEDKRRRYYAPTDLGRRVAHAEARRLEAQVAAAKQKKFLRGA